MLTNQESAFERALKVFGSEVNEAIQSFYAEQTIHHVARNNRQVFDVLNKHAAFWNLVTRAMQSNAIIVLGRIFDMHGSSHGVHHLLQLAEAHPDIFSKVSLAKRKSPLAGEYLRVFLHDAHVPTSQDFRRLRQNVTKYRAIYAGKYKVLRDKYFAHTDRADVTRFFANAQVAELERLLVFLSLLHDALWELFHNGRKPVLRRTRFSSRQILKLPERSYRNNREQEWITRETATFLRNLVSDVSA